MATASRSSRTRSGAQVDVQTFKHDGDAVLFNLTRRRHFDDGHNEPRLLPFFDNYRTGIRSSFDFGLKTGSQFGIGSLRSTSELCVGDEPFDKTLCISSIGDDFFNLKPSINGDRFNSLVNRYATEIYGDYELCEFHISELEVWQVVFYN